MPHLIVEHSANAVEGGRLASLLETLSAAATAKDILPEAGMRARAHRCENCRVGDGRPEAAFVHIQLRIGPGRSEEQKETILGGVSQAAKDFFAADIGARPFALSVELVELGLRENHSNLRDYIKESQP